MEPTIEDYRYIFGQIEKGFSSGKFGDMGENDKYYNVFWEITTTAEEDQTRININKWSEE